MPILSVIVPVFNIPENLLDHCIESLLAQTLQDIEFIIINDHSPNPRNAMQIGEFAAKDSRIRFVDLPSNLGVSHARNTALKMATGKYIGFVDADDYIAKEMYEQMIQFAEEHDLQCVQCNSRCYLDSSQQTFIDTCIPTHTHLLSGNSKDYIRIFQNYAFRCCDKIYHRELIGNSSFITGLTNYEDYIFNWQILTKWKKIGSTDLLGYFAICRNNSASRSEFNLEKYERIYNSLEQLFVIADGLYDQQPALSRYLMIYLLNLGLVNREILKDLHPEDGPKARQISYKHFQQYATSPKQIPGCIRIMLRKRMKKEKNFTYYPPILYYMLKICMKIYMRLIVMTTK